METTSFPLADDREIPNDIWISFWSNVDKTLSCWNWTGGMSHRGRFRNASTQPYGAFFINHHTVAAHRISYIMYHGSIPIGLSLDHLCRNTLCVNPDHLEAVSTRENLMRGFGAPAQNARKEYCIRGHLLSGSNLYKMSNGYRQCRECDHLRHHKMAERRKNM